MKKFIETLKVNKHVFVQIANCAEFKAECAKEGIYPSGGIAFVATDPRNPMPHTDCQCFYI